MLAWYKGNFPKALMTCFPNVGLSVTKFTSIPRNYLFLSSTLLSPSPLFFSSLLLALTQLKKDNHFQDVKRRKEVLEEFAQSCGFDSKNCEEWYKISAEEFLRFKQVGERERERDREWERERERVSLQTYFFAFREHVQY